MPPFLPTLTPLGGGQRSFRRWARVRTRAGRKGGQGPKTQGEKRHKGSCSHTHTHTHPYAHTQTHALSYQGCVCSYTAAPECQQVYLSTHLLYLSNTHTRTYTYTHAHTHLHAVFAEKDAKRGKENSSSWLPRRGRVLAGPSRVRVRETFCLECQTEQNLRSFSPLEIHHHRCSAAAEVVLFLILASWPRHNATAAGVAPSHPPSSHLASARPQG